MGAGLESAEVEIQPCCDIFEFCLNRLKVAIFLKAKEGIRERES